VIAVLAAGCSSSRSDSGSGSDSSSVPTSESHPVGGFGDVIEIGTLDEVRTRIADSHGAWYVPEGRCWLVATEDGEVIAIYQKCTHLGCRVPYCETSGWFECPCHRSIYDHEGNYVSGPAPRGLDRFGLKADGQSVYVDTSTPQKGRDAALGASTAVPAGPNCVTGLSPSSSSS
jgi:cytochrome b6-f complex iron-sulfur subunit